MTELIHILDLTLLTSGGEAAAAISAQAGGSHALLSAVHTDTLAAGIARGAVIVGNSSLKWAALAHPGAANRVLQSSALDTAWSGFALAIEAASAINQDLTTDAVATFAGIATPHYLGSAAAGDFLQDPASAGYTQTAAAQRIRIGWQPGSQYTIGRDVNTGYLAFIGSQTGYTGYTFNGPVNLSDGSSSVPGLSFINETSLGLRRVSAGVIGVNHLQIVDNGTVVTLSRVA